MTVGCYFCGQLANSSEHVPPKCIFPEQKDTDGVDYRKNLITVPSCDIHNGNKSKDDEYLMMVLAAHYENNQAAQSHVATKIFRSWKANPEFARIVVKNPSQINMDGEAKIGFELDSPRFRQAIEWIAHGLYFHQANKRPIYHFKMIAAPIFQFHEDAQEINFARLKMLNLADIEFDGQELCGNNPQIFWYQIKETFKDMILMRLCFYESFPIVLIASRDVNTNFI